jgi:hypothetical protein
MRLIEIGKIKIHQSFGNLLMPKKIFSINKSTQIKRLCAFGSLSREVPPKADT